MPSCRNTRGAKDGVRVREKLVKGGESSGESIFRAGIKSMFSRIMLFSLMPLPVIKRQINRD